MAQQQSPTSSSAIPAGSNPLTARLDALNAVSLPAGVPGDSLNQLSGRGPSKEQARRKSANAKGRVIGDVGPDADFVGQDEPRLHAKDVPEDAVWDDSVAASARDGDAVVIASNDTATDSVIGSTTVADTSGVAVSGTTGLLSSTTLFSPAVLGGVGLGVAALAASGGGGKSEPVVVAAPAAPVTVASPTDVKIADTNGDTRPNISGNATSGALITIKDPTGATHTVTAGTNGHFELEIPLPSQSLGTWEVTASDGSGNVSKPASVVVTDLTAPDIPTIDFLNDSVGSQHGAMPDGSLTNDARATITGTAEANSVVTLRNAGVWLGTAIADASGAWTFTPPAGTEKVYLEGLNQITAQATDAFGNVSRSSDVFKFTLDDVAPEPAKILSFTDDVEPFTGPIVEGSLTNDSHPTLTGTGEVDALVFVHDGEKQVGAGVVGPDGYWKVEVSVGDGSRNLVVTLVDTAGNVSQGVHTVTFNVDTVKPPVPDIVSATQTQGSTSSDVPRGSITKDAQLVFAGTEAEVGTTILLMEGNSTLGTAKVGASGEWSIAPTIPLGLGVRHIVAVAMDRAGNKSDASSAFDVTVVTGGTPTFTSIISVIDDTTPEAVVIHQGGATKDQTPTVQGTAIPKSIVTLYSDTSELGTAPADENGIWSITPALGKLLEGAHAFTAKATDAQGHVGDPSNVYQIVIDITAPGKIDKLVVTDDVPDKVGPIADGDVTDDATPTFSGTGEPGTTVYIREGSLEVGSAKVKPDGSWTITPTSEMAPGPHDLRIVAVDAVGNVGRPTAFGFTIDISTALVSIDSVYDGKAPKTGFVSMGSATDDQHPTVSGKANAGGTVTLYDADKTVLGTAVAGPDGRWSITSATLDPGSHALTASVTTAAGKVETTGPFPLVIDIHKTATPVISTVEDNEGPIKGLLTNGQPTDDTTPELRGTTEPGSTVAIFEGNKRLGDADVDKWGNWKFTPTTPLNPGKHDITVIATDEVGIVSEPSQPWSVVIDKDPPTKITTIEAVTDNKEPDTGRVDKGATTNDARPVVSGTAQAGTTVTLFDGTEEIGSATTNGSGVWSITPTRDLINGGHHLTAVASTPVGTPGEPSAAYDFSVLAGGVPTGIAITDVLDDTGPVARTIARDGLTKDRTPTVEGTAQKGERVTLYSETNEVLGTAVVGEDGHWRITSTVELSAGPHGLRAVATDPSSGRSGTPTAVYPITLDFSTEAAKNLTLTDHVGPKTGAINEGDTTDDSTPTFAGTAEPGATITVKDGEVELGTTKVKPDGTWSFTHPLKDGHHALTATVTDEAGNVAIPEESIGFYVKAGAGDVLVSINEVYDAVPLYVGPVEFGGVTNDNHPKVSGRATPGGTVTLYADGKKVDAVVADAHTGLWSISLTNSDALKNDGLHTLTATVTPQGGVESEPTQFDLTIDHTPPGEAHIEQVLDKVGSIRGPVPDGGATDDTTPTLSGVADAYSKVTIFNNGEWMAEAEADQYGNWHVTPTTAWNPGSHALTLTSTDKSGNVTATTTPWTVIVDVEAPPVPTIAKVMDNREPDIGPVVPGTSMNDPEPVVSGMAQKGVTVTLWDGADKLGSGIADLVTGIWSIHVDHFLLNGEHHLTATAADAVGNTSKRSDPFDFKLAAGAVPPPPTITNVIDDEKVDDVDRNIQSGGHTKDKTPTVIGTATAGSTVTLYDENHKELGSAISDPDGQWRIVSDTLEKGAHTLLATAIDPSTKVAQSTSSFLLNIDLDAPKVLGNLSLIDDVGPDVGQILNGTTTDDKTPTFSGTGQTGATVEVRDGMEVLGTTLVKPDGTWSFTPRLENGIHSLTATQTDLAGNVSTPTAPKTFYVDDSKVQVSIDQVYDNVEPVVGPVMPGTTTNDRRPVISGMATRGGLVTLYEGNEVAGATFADERTGQWSIRVPDDLAKGTHVFDATVTPSGGIESQKTSVSFVVDFTKPSQPKITMISDNVGPIQGDYTDGRPLTTDDTTPTLRGTAEPYCVIAIFVNGERMDVKNEVKSDAQGAWHYTLASGLPVGNNSIHVVAIDGAGNVSDKSNPWAVIIDISKVDPGTTVIPSIEAVWNDQGSTPVKVLFGTTTNDDTPTFKGKGEPDTVVVLMDGLERLGTADVGKDGTWEFTPTRTLKNGEHHVTAATLSPTGNAGTASPVFEFNLLAGGVPTGTSITSVFDDTNLDSLVYIERDGYTRDTTPVVKGTALAGMTVKLYNESAELLGTGIAGADGQWRIVVADDHALSEGIHALRAVATDSLGRRSDPTGPYGLTVDLKAPILNDTVLNDDVGPKTGAIKNGDVTDDSTPTFTGKGEPGAKVTVILDGVENLGTTEVKPDGTWTFPSKVLLDGPHTLTVTSVDKSGNVSDPVTVNFVVDQSDLTISLDRLDDTHDPVLGPLKQGDATNDQRPTVIGRTSANTVVKIYDETNAQLGSVVSDSRGDWKLQLTVPLDPGQHTLYATATKSNGDVATSNSFAFEIDIQAPKAPTIDGNDDDVGLNQGNVANGAPTDDTTPTLSGTAEAKANIILYEGTKEVGRAKADAYGNWHTTLQTPLNQGTHPIVAVASDRTGNVSPNSNEWKVVVDISIPNPPTITKVMDNQGSDVGPLASGDTTDETRPSVSGIADPGVTVTLWDGSDRLGSAITDLVTGAWTIKPEGFLINGDHHLTAVSTNPAGSVSKPSSVFDIHVFAGGSATATSITDVVDDTDPNHRVSIEQGALTSDPTPTVNGTAQPGATVKLYDKDGSLLGTTIATPKGEWHITTPILAPGGHEVTVESVAANGDILAGTGPRSFLVDTHVPKAADKLKLYDDQQPDTGDIPQHGVTDDSTPTFSGTTEEAFGTITVYDGIKQVGTTKADAIGNWSFTHYLPDGAHSYTATVTSVAGKTGPATKAIDFVVKTADVVVSIEQVLDDVPPITGPVTPGGATDDPLPTVSGKATRGGLVTLYDGIGTKIGTATADIHTGKWSIQIEAPDELREGEHLLRATVTPVGGVESAAQPFTFTVDHTPPKVPEIQSIVDDVGNTTGPMSQNTNTDDVTPTLNGKADPNTTVAILKDGQEVGRADVNAAGQWSFTVDAPPVAPGTHKFTVVGVDNVGNTSKESPAWFLIFDTSGTKLPDGQVDPLSNDVVAVTYITRDTGPKNNDFVTSDNTLVFGGTTDAVDGSRVDVRLDGKHLAYVTVTGHAWSYDHTRVALDDGYHVVRADLVDLADNVAKSSDPQLVVVDTHGDKLPDGTRDPLIDKVIAVTAVTRDSGISPVDFITNDPTLVFYGTSNAADGTYVALQINGRFVERYAQVFGGLWSFDYTETKLAIGTYSVRADLVDLAGNLAVSSQVKSLEIDVYGDRFSNGNHDTLADQTISVTKIVVDSGISDSDFITNSPRLVISGVSSAPDDSNVALWVNGEFLAYLKVTKGAWSYDYTAKELAAGYYDVRADLVDVAGNIAVSSSVRKITMDRSGNQFADGTHDTLADQTIAVTAIHEDNGVKPDDFYTRDRTLVFSGSSNAPDGSNVAVWLNGVFLAYVKVAGGTWSYDYTDHSLSDGYYKLQADLVDVAGNIAVASQVKGFAIDNNGALMPDGTHDPLGDQAIAVTSIVTDTGVSDSDFITNATSVTAHGTGFANAWIQVFLDDKYLGNQQIDGSGKWTYDLKTPQGGHTIKAHYIDLAENVVPGPVASHDMTVDTTAPTLEIQVPAGTAKGAETVYFNFSEAVTGFDVSDVALSKAKIADFTKIDDSHYSATITPVGTGSGTMNISVAANSFSDVAGNGGVGDSESQEYFMGPPAVLDLGTYGQGILPWWVPGTNKAFYYLDINKDGNVESWPNGNVNTHDDALNFFELRDMFNGGADMTGQTFTYINGHHIALPGAGAARAVSASGSYVVMPGTVSQQSPKANFMGVDYVYNNVDDLYALEYVAQGKEFKEPQTYWTGVSTGIDRDGNFFPTQRVYASSSPATFNNVPLALQIQKMDGAGSSVGIDHAALTASYIGGSNEDMMLNPSWYPSDGNRWKSHYVVFMYEMPVI